MDVMGIKRFVRQDLGCGCPDEVFADIRLMEPGSDFEGKPVDHILALGGRLLILICGADQLDKIIAALGSLLQSGLAMRDQGGYNRLRMVVPVGDNSPQEQVLKNLFATAAGADARAHLHVINRASLPELSCGS